MELYVIDRTLHQVLFYKEFYMDILTGILMFCVPPFFAGGIHNDLCYGEMTGKAYIYSAMGKQMIMGDNKGSHIGECAEWM